MESIKENKPTIRSIYSLVTIFSYVGPLHVNIRVMIRLNRFFKDFAENNIEKMFLTSKVYKTFLPLFF